MLNIDLDELKILNPQYKRLILPAYNQPYPLRLKHADILRFIELEDSIYKYKYDELFSPMKVYEGLFTGVPANPNDYKKVYHTVRQGESLAAIANKYGLSVYEIKKMNNLGGNSVKSKQKLLVGYEYIKPPQSQANEFQQVSVNLQNSDNDVQVETKKQEPQAAPRQTATESVVYIVKKGDSLNAIASKYGITARKIADYNNLRDINAITVGQKLKIPPK